MSDRMPAWALKMLLAWAFRPLAVPNGNRLGRFRPSRPTGRRALAMKPSVSRSAWIASMPGNMDIRQKASLSRSSCPLSRRGQKGMRDRTGIAKTTFSIKNWLIVIIAWIKAASQRVNDGEPILLNEFPNVHVDWNAFRLNTGDGFGAVLRPEDHTIGIDAGKPVGTTNLSAQ